MEISPGSDFLSERYDTFSQQIESRISSALDNERRVALSKHGQLDQDLVMKILNKGLSIDESDKQFKKLPSWIIGVRSPHLYKKLVDMSFDQAYWHHDVDPTFDLEKIKEDIVGEELLHGVPTLGDESVTDRIYGLAFFYDTVSRKPLLQPFFAYIDKGNMNLKVDVALNPSRVTSEHLGEIDKKLLEHEV